MNVHKTPESLKHVSIHAKGVDPRVKRTRQLLQQAFLELFREKSFASITVQDIAERATVNRATFYAHFEDKYALLDSMIREQFQQVVASELPASPKWGISTLRVLIQTVFGFLGEVHSQCKSTEGPDLISPRGQFDFLLGQTVQQELYELLLTGLKQVSTVGAGRRVPVETIAMVMSWAILGAAVQCSHGAKTISAEQMTEQVLIVITEGVARLTPGLLVQ